MLLAWARPPTGEENHDALLRCAGASPAHSHRSACGGLVRAISARRLARRRGVSSPRVVARLGPRRAIKAAIRAARCRVQGPGRGAGFACALLRCAEVPSGRHILLCACLHSDRSSSLRAGLLSTSGAQ